MNSLGRGLIQEAGEGMRLCFLTLRKGRIIAREKLHNYDFYAILPVSDRSIDPVFFER